MECTKCGEPGGARKADMQHKWHGAEERSKKDGAGRKAPRALSVQPVRAKSKGESTKRFTTGISHFSAVTLVNSVWNGSFIDSQMERQVLGIDFGTSFSSVAVL